MTKRTRTAIVALAGMLIISLVAYLSFPQPSYRLRSLESWVADFRLMGGPKHERAREAVRHMGTNAIPKLIEMLRTKDLDWKLKLQDWTSTWPVKYHFQPASVKHWRAMTALEALGPLAVPALLQVQSAPARTLSAGTSFVFSGTNPAQIARSMNAYSEEEATLAQRAIMEIGEKAVPPLVNALSNTSTEIRIHAVGDLGSLRSDGETATPALKKALEDSDQRVRRAATNALRLIASDEPDREK